MSDKASILEYKCPHCGKVYDRQLKICPVCHAPNHKYLDGDGAVLKVIKAIFIPFWAIFCIGWIVEMISLLITQWIPQTWDILKKTLMGEVSILYGGLVLMTYVLIFIFAWGIPILIVRAFIKAYKKQQKKEEEMFDKVHELNERKFEFESQKYMPQKIVKCEYCGKQVRFGNGTCPCCGAKLIKPE